jgi:hypothetical protein
MKDWKYILYLALAFGAFVVVKLMAPKEYNWTVTLAPEDKNPYGAFALSELLPSVFANQKIEHSYATLYELKHGKDSILRNQNIFVLAQSLNAGNEDTQVLLNHVSGGGTAFISAQHFYGKLADTLLLKTADAFFEGEITYNQNDSIDLKFVASHTDTTQRFHFRRNNTYNYFEKFDTTRTTIVATNSKQLPVTIRVKWGQGYFIFNTTPLAFSNIYILSAENHSFISTTLSFLPVKEILWTEFYQLGRMEAQTPLRFILTNEPLRWAYYISILSVLIFMLFEAKRKQRIIPIIKPLANTTLAFVGTIGNLYFGHGDHKNIADKKIIFFLEQVRTKFWLNTQHLDNHFIESLSRKSGQAEIKIRELINTIQSVQSRSAITADELIELNRKIEIFNNTLR